MTDVQSFAESEKLERSNIIVIIVQIGIEQSGKRQNNSPWRGKKITMQDKTGLIKVSMAWRDQSKSFEEGKSYKLYDVSWKPYQDSMQLQLSTISKIEPIQTLKKEKPKIEEKVSSDEYLKKRQAEIEKEQKTYDEKIQSLMKKYPEYVTKKKEDLDKLLILDSLIDESLTKEDNLPPNPQKVGLYMKILNEVKE